VFAVRSKKEATMTCRFQVRLVLSLVLLSLAPVIAHADYLYTVNVAQGFFQATTFSFTETTLATSGDVTGVTNISGVSVDEFAWNSAASGSCFGITFVGQACAGWKEGFVTNAAGFAPGSFLTAGFYSGGDGSATVSITCTNPTPTGECSPSTPTPEPSSLMLLGGGLAGFAGVIRRKLRR
jgi:hypothetical protein